MVYLAIVAVTEGRGQGYAAVAGVALGLGVVGIAAALGVAAAISAAPVLYQSLRWAGVFYLLWLAIEGWRDAGAAAEADLAPARPTAARFFGRGLVTNLLNPKAAVFYIAVLPGFVVATAPVMPQTLWLSATYVLVATLIHAAIVTLSGTLRPLLEDPGHARIVRRVLSFGLALVAVWFAWKTRAG